MNSKTKGLFSLIACLAIAVITIGYRTTRTELVGSKPLKVTTWDALGYYMYLPGVFIYQDLKNLEWLPEIDKEYELTGGSLYQARLQDNDQYIFKYLGGVAILQTPWFFVGHIIAKASHYKADGFSPPYQYAIAYGAVIYCLLAIFLLRSILLRYYSDKVTAIALILLVMATNFLQYVAVDSGMSHAFIFPLYVLILYATIRWHAKPSLLWSMMIGLIIGLATISRPTEAIMLFIPLLWDTHNKRAAKEKWAKVKANPKHVLFMLLFGFVGILPQLIYWQYATGFFIYDVGSKWVFFNPWFRVLFGATNGWFLYTPITLLFVAGLFTIKNQVFRKSVVVFCILNIWIIISWFDWKYGATYSTRALVQSYPVFALAFAGVIDKILSTKWRYSLYAVGVFLIYLNFFQLRQYQSTVIHSTDMNLQYYDKIFLNPSPSPLDMSLLDTDVWIGDESSFTKTLIYETSETRSFQSTALEPFIVIDTVFEDIQKSLSEEQWLRVRVELRTDGMLWGQWLCSEIIGDTSQTPTKIRLYNAISDKDKSNVYEFYFRIPTEAQSRRFRLYFCGTGKFWGEIEQVQIHRLSR